MPAGRSAAGSWPEPDWDYEDRGGRDQHRSDPHLPDSGLPESYLPDHYRSDPREAAGEPAVPDRPPRQGGTRSYKLSEPGAPSGQRPYGELERSRGSGTHRRADRDADAGWSSDQPSGRGRSRRGRRGGDERPARPFQPERDDWASGEQQAVWAGGADELEPLPPLEDPGRRRAWGSAEESDWGRLDEAENPDPRWAAPLPEFEPEYEGDTW